MPIALARAATALLLAGGLAAAAAADLPAQARRAAASAAPDAATPWLRGGTLTYGITFRGESSWARSDSSWDRSSAQVQRSVRATVRLTGRRSATNPLAAGAAAAAVAAPPALGGDTLARLRTYLLGEDIQYEQAMALCGGNAACTREMGRLMDERMRREMGSLMPPKPTVADGSRYVILEPSGPSACDSARVTVGDGSSESRERPDGRRDGPAPTWDRSATDAWDLPEAPELAAVCGATLVLDLQEGVYHLAFPHGGRVTLEAETLERSLAAPVEPSYARHGSMRIAVGGGEAAAGPAPAPPFVFGNRTLPQLSDEIARRMVRGAELVGSGTVERVHVERIPGHWWDAHEVPVDASVWWRYEPARPEAP